MKGTAEEFATAVAELLKENKEILQEYIDQEDWEGLRDEIYYILVSIAEEGE